MKRENLTGNLKYTSGERFKTWRKKYEYSICGACRVIDFEEGLVTKFRTVVLQEVILGGACVRAGSVASEEILCLVLMLTYGHACMKEVELYVIFEVRNTNMKFK